MLSLGQVVFSLSGRDKGRYLAVFGYDNNRVCVCDGKERPLQKAKSKNTKHIKPINKVLTKEQMASNRELRRVLREIAAGDA